MTVADEIRALYASRGGSAYYGEPVSMLEHGLQAAHFAAEAGAAKTLIVAALLHDVGHLLEQVPADIADWRSDAHHEETGARWLAQRFPPEVSDPVRLHVPAKRYLCATERKYFEQLSAASVHTLQLQGGPMSAVEIAAFEREPYHRDAVRVRRWDDAGKVENLKTGSLEDVLVLVESVARRAAGVAGALGAKPKGG